MRKRRPFVFAVITLLSVAHAFGASRTWTGGNSALWSDGGNWAGGVAPQSGDDLVFGAGASNLATVNDLAVGFPINSISITSAGYSLNGARINLGAGGISASASGSIVIPLVLTAAQTWTSSASAVLTTNSSVNLNGQTLTLNSAGGDGNITGVISGSGTIIKIGGGGGSGTDWTLSGTNTFSGQIQINNGRLIANNASAFGVSDNTLPNGIVINGGTLVFNNFSFGAEYIQVSLGGNNGNGAFQANGTPILNGTTELGPGLFMNVLGGSNLTFAGLVTGSGTFHIAGGGIYTLANSGNNFSGGVVYTGASTITLGNDNVVPNSVSLDLPANAVFNVNTHQETITAFSGAGNVNLGSGAGGTLTLTNQTGTHTGVISGIGAIIQSSGNVTYSGVNTYTGSYTTNGGVVNVSGGALPANYSQSAGTLNLLNNAAMGAIAINGGSIGGRGSTGNLALNGGVNFLEAINGPAATQYNNLQVTGSVNLANATLVLSGSGAGVVAGNTLTIIDNDGVDPVVGTFAGLPNGSTINNGPGGLKYTITYNGGSGNDVVLTAAAATPVPAFDARALAALAVLLALIALTTLRR